jgi:hypothetical protein
VGALPPAARDALIGELERTLRPHVDDEGVVTPIEIHLATGHC